MTGCVRHYLVLKWHKALAFLHLNCPEPNFLYSTLICRPYICIHSKPHWNTRALLDRLSGKKEQLHLVKAAVRQSWLIEIEAYNSFYKQLLSKIGVEVEGIHIVNKMHSWRQWLEILSLSSMKFWNAAYNNLFQGGLDCLGNEPRCSRRGWRETRDESIRHTDVQAGQTCQLIVQISLCFCVGFMNWRDLRRNWETYPRSDMVSYCWCNFIWNLVGDIRGNRVTYLRTCACACDSAFVIA